MESNIGQLKTEIMNSLDGYVILNGKEYISLSQVEKILTAHNSASAPCKQCKWRDYANDRCMSCKWFSFEFKDMFTPRT